MEEECHWGGGEGMLLTLLYSLRQAMQLWHQCLLCPFFLLEGAQTVAAIGHSGQSVAATSKQPEPLALKVESASVRGLVRHAESRFQPRPSESEPAF